MKNNRKTLKQQAYQYSEVKELYKLECAKANSNIIFGKLKLDFLKWLETSGAGNTHFEWETEKYSSNDLWESFVWQEAIFRLSEDLRSDDFFVDIIGNLDNYTIRVGLWDNADKNK